MNDKKMAPKVRGIWLLEFFGVVTFPLFRHIVKYKKKKGCVRDGKIYESGPASLW